MTQEIKNVLITGASSGIGEALAKHYAKERVEHLFLCGRNAERLEQTAKACRAFGVAVDTCILDVTDRAQTARWIKACDQKAQLHLVFANAGVSTGEETPENIYRTFETNIFGVLNTLTPALECYRHHPRQKAVIALTASIAGYHGLAGCPSYSASKSCVKAYGEALRPRLAKEGIQINVICPGFVRSRITDKNTCPMPFFMEAEQAATVIAKGIERNTGLIAFPLPMRFAAWFGSILPHVVSNFIYAHLPYKV